MFSSVTNQTYFIGTKVRDIKTGKVGVVYQVNVLRSNGIRVKFSDKSKKGYFSTQLLGLEIIS